MVNLLVVGVFFFLMSTPSAWSQTCEADLNNDGEVNKLDWQYFKEIYKAERGMTDCDLSASSYPAPVEKTGQTNLYAMGDDGDLQKGVELPVPRFKDNKDGTITDNLTGLIWLKDANCFGTRTWHDALPDCNGLADGQCGLTDGSKAGDWRLPNKRELFSLIHDGYSHPALSNTAGTRHWTEGDPFNNVLWGYWSSTTHAWDSNFAWAVYIDDGDVYDMPKIVTSYVWPVRGDY